LEVCLSQGFLIEYNLKAEFFRKLQDMPINRSRLSLEYITDKEKIVWNPMDIFADKSAFQYSPKAVIQNQYYLTRKVIVIPTTLIIG
jgi:hypothetical protein